MKVEWVVSGPLPYAFGLALRNASKTGRRYRVRRRQIGGVYLRELDGTPVWDVIPY